MTGHGLRIGMASLSTTGGSSIVATELSWWLRKRGLPVQFCHCNTEVEPSPDAFPLMLDRALKNEGVIDTDRLFTGGIDVTSQVLDWHRRWPFDVLHLHF